MELRRLHYFVVLAEELNFRRAADRLCIAQPGLSQQIRVLEREVGAGLFQRGRTGVSLTPAGEVLRDRAVALLGQVDRMINEVQQAAAGRSGTIRLGSLRSIIDSRADEILRTFQQANPAVKVILDASWETRHDRFSMLREAVVDAAFIHLPQPEIDDELAVLPLGTNELVVALPRAHPLARRRKIRSEDLTGTSLILWPRDQAPLQFDEIRSIAWSDQAVDLVASEPDVERLLARVAASPGGVSVVDAPRAARLRPRGVVFRPFTPPVPVWAFGLVWMPRRVSPVLELFLGWCRDHAVSSLGGVLRHEARGVGAACLTWRWVTSRQPLRDQATALREVSCSAKSRPPWRAPSHRSGCSSCSTGPAARSPTRLCRTPTIRANSPGEGPTVAIRAGHVPARSRGMAAQATSHQRGAVLRAALNTFTEVGATPWAHRAESELRACGVAVPVRAQTAAGPAS